MLFSRFLLNLRNVSDVSNTGFASDSPQLQTLVFAQRSRAVGSIGLHLEFPDIDEAVRAPEGAKDEATEFRRMHGSNPPPEVASFSREPVYTKEVR